MTCRDAPHMIARLVVPEGASAAIVGFEEQLISDTQPTIWRWTVTPQNEGALPLTAQLSAPLTVDGKESPYNVRTFEAHVTVFVTPTTRVRDFVAANWEWLWAVIVVPVAGWWWRKRGAAPHQTVKGRVRGLNLGASHRTLRREKHSGNRADLPNTYIGTLGG